ncbi:histidine--tRNA ligase [Candidatus Giovannonibacteria bacterium RIFCSPHIGHO2_12_44_12]|uniref:Histidine--tRNA ligase n=4 Tax=Candidatus Giovannoniibacteriota TaxID=1752738 RepID=A0A1F5WYB9_9BACT|nr:MAG: Histidine-tRNA ligase [Candidatus Giovannonibacteria bacterium GW2011_GWB1_43_13]OGF73435.1 MAG: histidine--tRNA ligase [Candidatus Giovannonibacteria bacterium RIFCSPHIGHO2_02_43_16]OGF80655.1 MAG: histidine--tRNA ligase [Candidatus Giovannonibacteria bacterium RIFCSPHIGHO2_12_44_12]OGF85673.1 MAG: histidine--tRNA ligase [Candidatus Giovannonibacteria bacterium RIFCSPLOWO2_02_44_8]OGF94867.1 MAG: histidine--tRNA ligase [Candidatus Giovannonibacteria bacterium RIFCSPLOWO2_12_43_8]
MKIKKDSLQTPKGTRDLIGRELLIWKRVTGICEEISSYYGFEEIRTPHFEHSELFSASLGETSDVVEKQMYSFRTRGGDSLVLRPEATVPIVRAYFEQGMQSLPQPVLLYENGSFFRHEAPQKGRYREFGQFDLEVLGEDLAVAEATVIRVFWLILKELGIEASLELNTMGDKECRPVWRKELTTYYRKHQEKLCKDCKRRFKENPIRLLDCKEQDCQAFKAKAPQMLEYVCDECKTHFKEVLEFMDALEIPYRLNQSLVRGFDYYTRTVFEFVADIKTVKEDGIEETKSLAVAAGGRYDNLGQVLAGKDLPGAGGGIGLDRVVSILSDGMDSEKFDQFVKAEKPKVFLIQLGIAAKRKTLGLMEDFRKAKIPLAQSLSKDSIRGQLRLAAKLGVAYSLIMGQKEALEGSVIIRDMDSGMQETLPISRAIERLRIKIK